MAVKNGTKVVLKLGGLLLVGETTSSQSFTRDMIETTNKHSTNQSKTFIPGEKGSTLSVSGLYDPDAVGYGFSEAYAAWDAGTLIPFINGGTEVSDTIYTGNGYISSLTKDSPQNDKSTFSIELQVTGEVTEGVVT